MTRKFSETRDIIKLAILAIGGQGGGVLADWVVHLAEANGYYAQTTSVPGVAQRTGATIYYLELVPETGRTPVLSLMPAPGDVDIVIAAELMEAGRAIMRGLVTPNRTTLIASAHRAYAVSEKMAPGDGIADASKVLDIAKQASHRLIAFDMESIAARNGSVISASLFGALAGSKALPFPRESFEETIRAGGKGMEASLKAFSTAFDAVTSPPSPATESESAPVPAMSGPQDLLAEYEKLSGALLADLPLDVQVMAAAGLAKTVDFQDLDYGRDYAYRLRKMLALDQDSGGASRDYALTRETAKYLANAMCYDDIIRVADAKTRGSRFARVRDEVKASEAQVLTITEFMHPRLREVLGTLPTGLARWIESKPALCRFLDPLFDRGRHVRTDGLAWFGVLYGLAGMRGMRRKLLRHEVESAHIAQWLAEAERLAPRNYDLAVEVIRCRRLIKGYSDTHERGQSKFDRVLSAVPLLEPREDGAQWLKRLREAALLDEEGTALDGALKTVATLET
ncbi:MAG: indolepyruvate oxidoreductase subunit beta family protein [Rhizobiales bacterium]|nr:indolepyruvate oxidoreductase subunit beta family protein [Hyphomicrobiales bacterium]